MRKDKKYRILVIIISATLILSLVFLTSCQKNGDNATNNNQQESPFPDTEASPSPESLGQFTVVIPDNGEYLLATENEQIRQAITDKILNDRGVNLDIKVAPLDYSDYFNQIMSLASSGQSIEGIVDKYSMFDTYMNIQNLCLPLDSLLQEDGSSLLNLIDADTWNKVTYNNQIMAMPDVGLYENTSLYVRSDITKMMGINQITTREELEATLFALSIISEDDVVPLAMNWNQAFDYFTYLFRVPSTDYWKEGDTYIMREQSRYFDDFLDMMKKFYQNGYISEDFFDLSEDEVTTMFTSGLAMMYIAEYDQVDKDYETLLSTVPTAEVSLLRNPASIKMKYPILSAEDGINNICIFAGYGQNHSALMTYFDWLVSNVESYETTALGIFGTQVNFNNYAHEYQYLGSYDSNSNVYNSLYTMGFTFDRLFYPVVPINGDSTFIKTQQLKYETYEHLSTADKRFENSFELSDEAKNALYYYRSSMDEAIRRYIMDEINYNEFRNYLANNENNYSIIINELNSLDSVE